MLGTLPFMLIYLPPSNSQLKWVLGRQPLLLPASHHWSVQFFSDPEPTDDLQAPHPPVASYPHSVSGTLLLESQSCMSDLWPVAPGEEHRRGKTRTRLDTWGLKLDSLAAAKVTRAWCLSARNSPASSNNGRSRLLCISISLPNAIVHQPNTISMYVIFIIMWLYRSHWGD